MANVTSYDAKDTTITVDGVHITGLGEDMISWEKEEDFFETAVGAQGDVVVSETNNDIHNMTVTVQPTSPQFPMLIDLQKKKKMFPVWGINKKLGVRFGGTQARVKEAPEITLGTAAEDAEFVICVFDGVTEAAK